MTRSEIFAWAGGVGSVLVVVGTMLWGVPYYIESAVEDRVNEIQAGNTPLSEAEPIVRLQSQVSSLAESQARIEASQTRSEDKLDRLYELYIQDLERRSQ